jgi:hypothetical protein
MAAFATFSAAETRAKEKVADKTWVSAHAARTFTGALCVRVQRFMSPSDVDAGEWVEITDDGTV